MKKISFILIVSMILLSLMPAYASTNSVSPIQISIDEEVVQFTDELGYPFIDGNNRTQVPFRVTLEKFGATVSWNNENYSAVAEKDGIKVEVPINQNYILKNGEKTFNDTKAIIKDGRTYLPIRVVLEAFGCKVGWDNNTKTVLITSTESHIVSQLDLSDIDTDKDGLSDFQEKYKYYTDPTKADSDGDGIPDGDWNERREYAYTIYTKLLLTGPLDINAMNSDYQDAKIISTNDKYIECEIIFYPENRTINGIGSNEDWGNYGSEFDEYLKPYLYANWDEEMKSDLIKELKGLGIDIDVLSDKELVQRVSLLLREGKKSVENNWPAQFFLRYDENGKFYLDNKFRRGFEEKVLGGEIQTVEDAVNKLVLGKQMYYNKTKGGCTSHMTYAATIFRSLGIPTRHVLTTKIKYTPDLINKVNELQNPLVKEILLTCNKTSSNHTLTEVYIDGRWTRIDYEDLGAGSIFAGRGLYYQHYTPNDLSEIDMATVYGNMIYDPKWGPFQNGEFFKLTDISDSYGKFYKAVYPYDIDYNKYDKYVTFGENGFGRIINYTTLKKLEQFKILNPIETGSNISNLKEEYFNDNNIIIISANIDYNKLPTSIKSNITLNDYSNLKYDEYKTFEINNSIVLIIKK